MTGKYNPEYYKRWKAKKLAKDPDYFKYKPEKYKLWKDRKLVKDPDYFTKDRAEYYREWKAKKLAEDPNYYKRIHKKSVEKIRNSDKIIPNTRLCNSCNIIQEIEFFRKNESTTSGYKAICIKCDNIIQTAMYYENLELRQKRQREYYHANSKVINERQQGNTALQKRRRRAEDLNFAFVSDCYLRNMPDLKGLEEIPSVIYQVKRNILQIKRKVNEK
jgi:hypothetical protein